MTAKALYSLLGVLCLAALACRVASADDNPIWLKLTDIGRPTLNKASAARKINELFLFHDRLYIGHGDYGANTGPTDVMYLDLSTGKFVTEFTVQEEAITRYRVLSGKLVIPGVDSRESWTFGNIYVLGDRRWSKYRSVPRGIHVFDVAAVGDTWFASTGIYMRLTRHKNNGLASGAVFRSEDQGKSWFVQYTTPSTNTTTYRLGALAVFRQTVFAFPRAHRWLQFSEAPPELRMRLTKPYKHKDKEVFAFTIGDPMGEVDTVALMGDHWQPMDLIPQPNVGMVEPVVFRDRLIMAVVSGELIASKPHGDMRKSVRPEGMAMPLWAYDGQQSWPLPIAFDQLQDMLVKNNALSVLVLKGDTYFIIRTTDLLEWAWHALPDGHSIPMSIEDIDSHYYIGYEDGHIRQATR
jgi:hypothetical protein